MRMAQEVDELALTEKGKEAKEKEKQSLLAFLTKQRSSEKEPGNEPEKFVRVGIAPVPEKTDAKELAAWTQVCRVILNLHETITKY